MKMQTVKVAETFGMIHFAKGGDCIPCQCKNFNDLIKGLKVGESIPVLKAFIRGWTKANLA
jgi:hypothetical protein